MSSKRNLILIGQAEEIDLVREEVRRILNTEGIYLASDVTQPGATVPLAVIGGRVFSMKIDTELDPERFLQTVRFAGPFFAPPTDSAQ